MGKVVTNDLKERMRALMVKGLTNKEISQKLNTKLGTVSYHSCRIRKSNNGNGKKKLVVKTLEYKERSLNETFFGETVAGFFVYEEKLYCVMESGIAMIMENADSIPKESVDKIKEKMKSEMKQMERRIELFSSMEN